MASDGWAIVPASLNGLVNSPKAHTELARKAGPEGQKDEQDIKSKGAEAKTLQRRTQSHVIASFLKSSIISSNNTPHFISIHMVFQRSRYYILIKGGMKSENIVYFLINR
jgi:hypothetical protein